MYNGRRRSGAGELGILGEDQEPILLDERAGGNELVAQWSYYHGSGAILQDGGRALEYDEAVRRALASRFGSPEPRIVLILDFF